MKELDWEDAILAWRETEQVESQAQWQKGDIARDLKPIYGEHTLEKFAETVGADYGRLRHYKATAQAFESAQRCADLSYFHHEVLAPRDDRLEWLAQAAEHHWSVRYMLDQIAQTAQDKEDLEGQINRGAERLRQLVIGWIELITLGNNPRRTAILDQLAESTRVKVEEIETIYNRGRSMTAQTLTGQGGQQEDDDRELVGAGQEDGNDLPS